MAIDWVSLNWYLVDGGREALYVCERTLRSCRLLLDSGLSKVHGFALDPAAGLMFWTAWGATAPAVGRASLAGEDRRALAALKLVYPSALTADLPSRVLYWVDTYLECVERADYDGANRLTVRRGYNVSAAVAPRVPRPPWSRSAPNGTLSVRSRNDYRQFRCWKRRCSCRCGLTAR